MLCLITISIAPCGLVPTQFHYNLLLFIQMYSPCFWWCPDTWFLLFWEPIFLMAIKGSSFVTVSLQLVPTEYSHHLDSQWSWYLTLQSTPDCSGKYYKMSSESSHWTLYHDHFSELSDPFFNFLPRTMAVLSFLLFSVGIIFFKLPSNPPASIFVPPSEFLV